MSPCRCVAFVLMMVTALMLAVVGPVAAVPPSREEVPLPEGMVIPVPDICPFDVEVLVLTSGETMTTFRDQGGNVVMQLTTGPLKVRVTNVATGESRDLNIPGPGRITESGRTFIMTGPWLQVVPRGTLFDDPEFEAPALLLTKGRVVTERDETGTIVRFVSIKGRVEDICAALAS
jgi:hypothetical protein